MKAVVSSRFQPGEGPCRGLLRDCTTSPINRFAALLWSHRSWSSDWALFVTFSSHICKKHLWCFEPDKKWTRNTCSIINNKEQGDRHNVITGKSCDPSLDPIPCPVFVRLNFHKVLFCKGRSDYVEHTIHICSHHLVRGLSMAMACLHYPYSIPQHNPTIQNPSHWPCLEPWVPCSVLCDVCSDNIGHNTSQCSGQQPAAGESFLPLSPDCWIQFLIYLWQPN